MIISSKKPWAVMLGIFICQEAGLKFFSMDFENKLMLITNNEKLKELLLSPNKANGL